MSRSVRRNFEFVKVCTSMPPGRSPEFADSPVPLGFPMRHTAITMSTNTTLVLKWYSLNNERIIY